MREKTESTRRREKLKRLMLAQPTQYFLLLVAVVGLSMMFGKDIKRFRENLCSAKYDVKIVECGSRGWKIAE